MNKNDLIKTPRSTKIQKYTLPIFIYYNQKQILASVFFKILYKSP